MNWGMAVLLAIGIVAPAMLFLIIYFAIGRKAIIAACVTAVSGACAGAFLAAAGSAMATSVNPNDAMLRGAVIGFFACAGIAAVLAVVIKLIAKSLVAKG